MENLLLKLSSQRTIDWVKLVITISQHSSLFVYFSSGNTDLYIKIYITLVTDSFMTMCYQQFKEHIWVPGGDGRHL